MKYLILFTIVIVAISANHSLYQQQWARFKNTNNKTYSSISEETRKMKNFHNNLLEIDEHNRKYVRGEVLYRKEMNQFGDWTKEEFLNYVNKGKISKGDGIPDELKKVHFEREVEFGDSMDWRQRGAVTEVKNQGQCGSCWSFSTTGAIEGQLAITRSQIVSLSEQNLVDCSTDYGNNACEGGYMGSAFQYVHDYGIESESNYPYEAQLDYCRFERGLSVTNIASYYSIPQEDENALLNAVSSVGPVSVAIDATDELQFYAGGIFYDYNCDQQELNHGVLVVGYGTEQGYDYWLVKNSWGTGWGEGGYYKAARNMGNNCGIASDALYPVL